MSYKTLHIIGPQSLILRNGHNVNILLISFEFSICKSYIKEKENISYIETTNIIQLASIVRKEYILLEMIKLEHLFFAILQLGALFPTALVQAQDQLG